MYGRDPLGELTRLQALRARPSSTRPISDLIQLQAHNATKVHKRLCRVIEVWEQVVPPKIANFTSITNLNRGVLHVTVDSAAVAYELNQQLRAGLLEELRSKLPCTLVRVKTRVA
jgi:predicted nucleic acid-binding Zn ribbon protein